MAQFVNKPMWFMGFDIPSSHIKALPPTKKQFIRNKRWEVWYKLRYGLRARMIQNSLWKIPEDKIEKARELVAEWLKVYAAENLPASISLYPIQTTQSGLEWFDDMELLFFLDWLDKDLKLTEKQEVKQRTYDKFERKRQIIEDSVKEDYPLPTSKQKQLIKQINDVIDIVFKHLYTVKIIAA